MLQTTIVLRGLGLLLWVAASLKAYGLAVEPVSSQGLFAAAWVQAGLIWLEVLLGLWLLSGSQPLLGWVAAVLVFGSFALVSLYQGVIGQSSCGCFGRLAVNPWYTFGIDLAALAALALARPDVRPLWREPRAALRPARSGGAWCAGAALLVAVPAGAAHHQFGSLEAAAAYLRGESVAVVPRVVDFGEAAAGERREAEVEFANWTGGPVRVVGGSRDCSCAVGGDLPLTVLPGERRTVLVTVGFPGRPGTFTRPAHLLVDDGTLRVVPFQLTGRSLGGPATVASPAQNERNRYGRGPAARSGGSPRKFPEGGASCGRGCVP